jgi:ketosteroid isomerase-like protein
MASDPRIAAAQDFLLTSFRGDISSAIGFLDESVSYHVPGSHQASGDFEGRESVAQHLAKLLQLTSGTVNVLQWEDWMAGIDHVAALVHMNVQRRGAFHTFRAVYLFDMTDDEKIRRIEVFFTDQPAVERFFTTLDE